MSDYGTIKTALATQLNTSTHVEIVYDNPPDVPFTPSAIVIPGEPAVEYGDAMQRGLVQMFFNVTFLVQRFDMDLNIARLDR